MPRARDRLWLLVPFAALLVSVVYGPSLWYRFYWDDYGAVRPWRLDELQDAFTGIYRPLAVDARFYRPLTSLYYATAFELFGLNTFWLHLIPLIGLTLAATLFGVLMYRKTHQRAFKLLGTFFFAVHPNVVGSTGPWIANQYQTFSVVSALAALILWQRCRTKPARHWWPLVIPCLVCALFKEEGVLLPLVFPAIQWLRSRWLKDLPPPPAGVVWGAVVLAALLFGWRFAVLDGLGGYGDPITLSTFFWNVIHGPRDVLLRQRDLDALGWAVTAVKLALFVAALWVLWRRTDRNAAATVLTGLVFAIVLALPLGFVTGHGRFYFIATGAVLMIAGVAQAVVPKLQARVGTAAVAAGVGGIGLILLLQSIERVGEFAPCSPVKRQHDLAEVVAHDAVPAEIRAWLASPDWSCQVPLDDAVPVITYGLEPAPRPLPVRSARANQITAMITLEALKAEVRFRVPSATAAAPVHIDLFVNDQPVASRDVASPDWQAAPVQLTPSWRSVLWNRHRIDLKASLPDEARGAIEWQPLRISAD